MNELDTWYAEEAKTSVEKTICRLLNDSWSTGLSLETLVRACGVHRDTVVDALMQLKYNGHVTAKFEQPGVWMARFDKGALPFTF